MLKDTFFSMPRFINLCRKEIVESWKSNVLRIVLLYGVMTIVMVWNGYFEYVDRNLNAKDDPMWAFLLVVFIWSLWGFGCLSASFTMEKMKDKTSRLSVLMNPATPFEKYFFRWLICTVVFLIVFLITYKLADYTRVLIYSLACPERKFINPVDLSHLVGDGDYYTVFKEGLHFRVMIAGYLFVQSCFVLGSTIWPKNSFLKTFAVATIVVIIYTLVITFLTEVLLRNEGKSFGGAFVSENTGLNLIIAAFLFFALLNWILGYYRFKESEIINRM